MVRWTTLFVDRSANGFDRTRDFWSSITGARLSPPRGARGEFATLIPPDGDSCLRIQCVLDGPGGSHMDLHVADVRGAAQAAIELGATAVTDLGGVVVLRSPGGLVFCFVAHHGESVRSAPTILGGTRTIVDQVCIDVAPDRFDTEYEFWAACTSWRPQPPRSSEFRALDRPAHIPLRFLFQRRQPADAGMDAGCHADLACDDVARAVRHHVALGATVVNVTDLWTVMGDPSGVEYCLTPRNPDTGLPG
jgi:hypothetical protein